MKKTLPSLLRATAVILIVLGMVLHFSLPRQTTGASGSKGVTQVNVESTSVASQPTPVPPPMPSQAHFDKIRNAKLAHWKASEEKYKRLRSFKDSDAEIAEMERIAHNLADQGTKDIFKLIRLLIVDKIKGDNEAEVYMQKLVEPQTKTWMLAYAQKLNTQSHQLEKALNVETQQLAYELAEVSIDNGPAFVLFPPQTLQSSNMDELMRNLGIQSVVLGGSLILDADVIFNGAAIRVMQVMAKKVATTGITIASKMFGKEIIAVAAGGTVAVADGPFPFGDVILVGCAGWSAYDIYTGRKEFKEKLYDAVLEHLKQYRNAMDQQARTTAKNLRENHKAAMNEMSERAVEKLRAYQVSAGAKP